MSMKHAECSRTLVSFGLLLLTVRGSEIHTMVNDQNSKIAQPKQDLLLWKKIFLNVCA